MVGEEEDVPMKGGKGEREEIGMCVFREEKGGGKVKQRTEREREKAKFRQRERIRDVHKKGRAIKERKKKQRRVLTGCRNERAFYRGATDTPCAL